MHFDSLFEILRKIKFLLIQSQYLNCRDFLNCHDLKSRDFLLIVHEI